MDETCLTRDLQSQALTSHCNKVRLKPHLGALLRTFF